MDEKDGASFNLCKKCASGWHASGTSWDGKRDWNTASSSWGDNVDNDCGKKQRRAVSESILTDHTQDTIAYIDTNSFFQKAIIIGATNNTGGAGIMLHDDKNYAESHPTLLCEVIKLDPGDNSFVISQRTEP